MKADSSLNTSETPGSAINLDPEENINLVFEIENPTTNPTVPNQITLASYVETNNLIKSKYFFILLTCLHNNMLKLKDLFAFLLICLSIYCYIKSLVGCYQTQVECLINLSPEFFYEILIYLFLSSFIITFVVAMIYKNVFKCYHLIYSSVIYIYLMYYYDTGSELDYHGSYNRLFFFLFFFVFCLCFAWFVFLFRLLRNRRFFLFFSIIFSCSSVLFVIYSKMKGCKDWTKGLNDVDIVDDPSKNKCSIVQPTLCWYNVVDGVLDFTWLFPNKCNSRANEREELIESLPTIMQSSNYFGYPRSTNFSFTNGDSHFRVFFTKSMERFIDMEQVIEKDQRNSSFDQPEVTLIFNPQTKLGNIEINIAKNESLVNERDFIFNLLSEKEKPLVQNILIIYIDAISRNHFLRKLKKTSEFIENFMDTRSKTTSTTHSAFQFMKYQTFFPFTQPNINAMFYGESIKNQNGTHIIKHFKQKGFITAQAMNFCSREIFDIQEGFIQNIAWENFDHENVVMFCDPNYFNYDHPYTHYMGPYSMARRCLYGRDVFDYVLEYGEKFWYAYDKQRKFLRLGFMEAHEGSGEVVKYIDEKLSLFLRKLEEQQKLKDTLIIFLSDHGNNMIGLPNLLNSEDFVLEKTLGALFILLPKLPPEREYDIKLNMKNNQQMLISHYDIYNTMLDCINLEKGSKYYSTRGISLFDQIDGLQRDCDTFSFDMIPNWCRCKNHEISI